MTKPNMPNSDEFMFARTLRSLDSKLLGFVMGILFALIIFVATNWLVMLGGHVDDQGEVIIGPHLALLGQFFIGYKVTFWGSIIGALYGFAVGSIVGAGISGIYNQLSSLRRFPDTEDPNN